MTRDELVLDICDAAQHCHVVVQERPQRNSPSYRAARILQYGMPSLDARTRWEVMCAHSKACAGNIEMYNLCMPVPLRQPHYAVNAHAFWGRWNIGAPGEFTLAHGGILYLQELHRFRHSCLSALMEPLDSGQVTMGAMGRYPAKFRLIASVPLCPCDDGPPYVYKCRCMASCADRFKSIIRRFTKRDDVCFIDASMPKVDTRQRMK